MAAYNHVFFDTAPTGHTLRLFKLPAAWTGFIDTNSTGIIDQIPLTLNASLRKEIESKAEFTSAFKTAADVFAVINQVDMREISYSSDGLKVKGFIVAPKKAGRYPVLIWNRGGYCFEGSGVMTRYYVARWLAPLASWGYVVVASQYRGSGGSEGKDGFGGADLNDVLNLFPLLDTMPKADRSRIGMAGHSRGGLATYLALTKTDRIKAAVVMSGIVDVDFRLDDARRKELGLPAHDVDLEDLCLRQMIPNYDQNREREIHARSPIKWPENLNKKTPILILHGTSDWSVLADGPLDMAAALLRLRHPFRLVMFEGGDHDLVRHDEDVNRFIKAWLNHYVRDGKPWPSLEPDKMTP